MFRHSTALLAIILAPLLGAAAAHAGKLPSIAFLTIGFREARTTDFDATEQAAARRATKNGFLTVTRDFNGDGKADEARLLINDQRQVAYIVAVIQSPTKVDTYVLAQSTMADAADLGIVEAEPLPDGASRGRYGVSIVSIKTGTGEANYFDDEEFNIRVPVSLSQRQAA